RMLRAISAGTYQPGSGLGEFYRSIHYRDSTFANRPKLKRKTKCTRAGGRSRQGLVQREMERRGVRAGNSSPMDPRFKSITKLDSLRGRRPKSALDGETIM